MIRTLVFSMVFMAWGLSELYAFCGFYVAKADAKLFNKSSQVIIARDGDHTVITMSNDYSGDNKDFAMVVPVPEILKETDIRVINHYIFDKLDAYTAPRLVEYYDHNPCAMPVPAVTATRSLSVVEELTMADDMMKDEDLDLGVTIEAEYTVGEYDILILSAKESSGLKTWLLDNGYKIPSDADEVLDPYINDGMKFFVVKVNMEAQAASGFQTLRPIQIQFNSNRFMLPIRLGMANAERYQDLIVYAFTRTGRVETANYRTTKLPTDREIPEFVQTNGMFPDFYKSVFEKEWKNQGRNSVMLEYAWNISGSNAVKCDPCNTPLVTFAELREAGVWWINSGYSGTYSGDLFVTRLHARYSRSLFPQDLSFLITPERSNFQGRYVVRHPATGPMDCEEGKRYKRDLAMRKRKELSELAALTGWSTSRYSWYIGEVNLPKAEPPVLPQTDSLEIKPQQTTGQANQRVVNVTDPQGREVKVLQTIDPDTGAVLEERVIGMRLEKPTEEEMLAESEEFLEEAIAAGPAVDYRPYWLVGIAGLMFGIGVLMRRARHEKGGAEDPKN